MIKRLLPWLFVLVAGPALAAGGPVLLQSGANISDQASLQRGAQLYFNYCGSCHSLEYVRYSRLAKDLGLTEQQVMENLNFTGGKIGDTIKAAMPAGIGPDAVGAEDWFGKAPPDLSLIARARLGGADYTYTYLMSFYVDPTRPSGWNNTVFPNASMPHVLWERQGIQTLRPADEHAEGGDGHAAGPSFDLVKPGSRTPEEYRQDARDITAFLQYVGEPAALDREKYGIWVILYLLLFTGVAYLMKHEYWKDVH
ncbi:MAG TPA: cytochrome c1 [Xanthomonadales bacterium]|nr:cytochrome c1 [Xanthomonadales bacterium]